jgi:hypothetical protein
MNMIIDASNAVQMTIEILVNSPDIAIKKIPMAVGQGTLAILRREYDVKQQLGGGIRHGDPRANMLPQTRLKSHPHIIVGSYASLHPRKLMPPVPHAPNQKGSNSRGTQRRRRWLGSLRHANGFQLAAAQCVIIDANIVDPGWNLEIRRWGKYLVPI